MIDEISYCDESTESFSNPYSEPISNWKKIGQVTSFCFACLSCISIIFANRRKRSPQAFSISTNFSSTPLPVSTDLELHTEAPSSSYQKLRCTPEDQNLVYQVISPLGKENLFRLWSREEELKGLGKELRNKIHPFKFLETIFCHPELRSTVQSIFASTNWVARQKQEGFLKGVEWGMQTYGRSNQILCYVDDFTRRLYSPIEQDLAAKEIKKLIQQQNWDGLVRHLCLKSASLKG